MPLLAKKAKKPLSLRAIGRRFGRFHVNCGAMLAFSAHNTRPRIKGDMFQIGPGGCGISTSERLFIGEECLVWAMVGGHKYLGIPGQIVWMDTFYEDKEICVVGIEFKKKLELSEELLACLGATPSKV